MLTAAAEDDVVRLEVCVVDADSVRLELCVAEVSENDALDKLLAEHALVDSL